MFIPVNPLLYLDKKHVIKEATFLEAGLENVVLKYGHWFIAMAGAGGAGGGRGSGGNGGAGGYGQFTTSRFNLDITTRIQINVGEAGKTRTDGGNGGEGHSTFHNAGHGGGAGLPTYLTYYKYQPLYNWGSEDIYTRTNEVKTTSIIYGKNGEVNTSWSIEKIEDIENSTYKNVTFKYVTGDTLTISSQNTTVINSVNIPFYIYSNGGGGGGGGGGSGGGGRYSAGGGGGGGGGYFRFDYDNLLLIINIAGQAGGTGGSTYSASWRLPGSGVQGNIIDFPNLKSGGGNGGSGQGGAGSASGGGASGGGGGAGHNSGSAYAGAGGGAAGGDLDAGGGTGGPSATNPHIIPTSVAVRNMKYGIPENLGQGGAGSSTANTEGEEGNNGWVYLLRYEDINSIIDCQLITDTSISTIMDLGILGQDITQQQDMGHI